MTDQNFPQSDDASKQPLPETRYPCETCGAVLKFSPTTGTLECKHCGHQQNIAASVKPIKEHNFRKALAELANANPISSDLVTIKCPTCASQSQLTPGTHAGQCTYCGTPLIVDAALIKPFQPESLLPFKVTEKQALQFFRKWLGSLWFAPSALKKYASGDSRLQGLYVPYWTYDSDTQTSYSGRRGDVYHVRQNYTTNVNGRQVTRSRSVPRIRWTPASGHVSRHFDDVLIGASQTLPRQISNRLGPWDLVNLTAFDAAYLSGFDSEIYQVDLDSGFEQARLVMDQTIRTDIRRQIGGDQQQIHQLQTHHSRTTFKSLLLPVWMAEFRFRDKTYRFAVNARTGKTRGERPYSYLKIILAVILGLIVTAAAVYLLSESGLLEQIQSTYFYQESIR